MKTRKSGSGDATSPLLRRTRQGSHELVAKKLTLTEEQRKILLYANGRRTVDEVNKYVPETRSDPDLLLDMEAMGLIELVVMDDSLPVPRGEKSVTAANESVGVTAPAISVDVEALKRELIADLTKILGAESGAVVQRLQEMTSFSDIRALFPKIVDLIKLYSGAAASERLAGKFAAKI